MLNRYYPVWSSMDDLPDVEHTFAFCADLAEILVP
jgi:hypothetical protein